MDKPTGPHKLEIMPGPEKTIATGRHVGVTDPIPCGDFAKNSDAEERARALWRQEEKVKQEQALKKDYGHMADGPEPSEQMRENLKAKMHVDREFCVSCPKDGVCKTHSPDAEDLKESCQEMRKELLAIGKRLAGLIKDHPELAAPEEGFAVLSRRYEIADNAILMYRRVEDARMRAGKIIQALDGGTSIYPK